MSKECSLLLLLMYEYENNILSDLRLEGGPLEIQLMVNSCKEAARIKEALNLQPKMLTHKVSSVGE